MVTDRFQISTHCSIVRRVRLQYDQASELTLRGERRETRLLVGVVALRQPWPRSADGSEGDRRGGRLVWVRCTAGRGACLSQRDKLYQAWTPLLPAIRQGTDGTDVTAAA